jgi:hypothetical protein
MIWTLLPFGLVVVLVAAILLAAGVPAAKPACSFKEKQQGEDARANCLAACERFASVDKREGI